MSANPHANGGLLLHDLKLPDFRDYAVEVSVARFSDAEATQVMGQFLRDVMKLNLEAHNFRLFSPDESFQSLAGCPGGHEPRLGSRDPSL